MLLYYITDRSQFVPDSPAADPEAFRQAKLLAMVEAACSAGVDFIQLREKDLTTRQLETLASQIMDIVHRTQGRTRLLINSRTDVAIAVGAGGVHLRSAAQDISAKDARAVLTHAGFTSSVVAISCHTLDEIRQSASDGADFAVFGPVFGKQITETPAVGIQALAAACEIAGRMPVLALGGVNLNNAHECLKVGAAGIAGIRLFQESSVIDTVTALRKL